MAVVARALSDRRSDERRAHGCHSALLKGEVRDLTAWLDGPGIHRFFNGEHGSKRAFRRFKPPGWLRPFSRKDGCPCLFARRAAPTNSPLSPVLPTPPHKDRLRGAPPPIGWDYKNPRDER